MSRPSLRALVLFASLVLLQSVPSHAAELVMFERPGCGWCQRFDREVAPVYGKTEEGQRAPLRRMEVASGLRAIGNARAGTGFDLVTPVRFTPTFVLVDEGREIGRITGYMSDETFWGLLDALMRDLPSSQVRN